MDGAERREGIIAWLKESQMPVSGQSLRKIRCQPAGDRAGYRFDTEQRQGSLFHPQGLCDGKKKRFSRVYKVIHEDDEVEVEFNTIVDLGGMCGTCSSTIRCMAWCGPIWMLNPGLT